MRTSNEATVGTIAEMIAAKECVKAGWKIAYPYGSDTPFDFLLYRSGQVRSVQVKGTQYERKENAGATRMVSMDKYQNIDYLICVDMIKEECYVFEVGELPPSRIRITLKEELYPLAFKAFNKLV